MTKKYQVHGKKSVTGLCEDRPICEACDTGMWCDAEYSTHFCPWYKCRLYNESRYNWYRWRNNIVVGMLSSEIEKPLKEDIIWTNERVTT